MLERRESDGVVWYESPLLLAAGVGHAFSTRLGGVSAGVYSSLNFGNPSDAPVRDPAANIEENERRLFERSGLGGREHCRVHQVHGPSVSIVRPGHPHDPHQQADALVSTDPSRVVSVRVADCVPVLVAGDDGGVVGAVHAGWRGVATGVLPATIDLIRQARPGAALVAAIGPSIGFDAFEVGPEVIEEMRRTFGDLGVAARPGERDRWHVDLRALLARQLECHGVPRFDTTDRCTVRDEREFFSHRRDKGQTGRMIAAIGAR